MLVQENHPPSIERSSIERASLLRVPSSEVLERPKRKIYSAEYKRRILKEIEGATQPGQTGAILRREGIYMSNILTWRYQRERGELEGLSPKKRGKKKTEAEIIEARNKELMRENKRLRKKLERAELLLDIQKKISEITGIPLKDVELDDDD